MFDARLLVGPAMLVIGAALIAISMRLWLVRPVNRVWKLGPFVTEAGLKAVLNLRFTFFAMGAFLSVQGLTAITFWFGYQDIRNPLVALLGTLAAGLSFWAVYLTIAGLWRLWRSK